MPHSPHPSDPLVLGQDHWQLEDLLDIAHNRRQVQLSTSPVWRQKIEDSAAYVERLWQEGGKVYGVTTGYGARGDIDVPKELVEQLPLQLTRYHGCGTGAYLDVAAARGVLAARLRSLAHGYSGIRLLLLEQLAALLNHNITPLIPEEGSVGASGDLTPLSYVAAALMGEREVCFEGRIIPATEALSQVGLSPLKLRPKEGLAIMNGTAMMTALACQAHARAQYLVRLCSRITALAASLLASNQEHFHERLFAMKPHPGQALVAAWIKADLYAQRGHAKRLQARYSIRCAPHILGVLADALPWMRQQIETELNSVNDNPLVDVESGQVFHGGHFYGGHIGFAMDCLKNAVASVADLLDRQLALLVDPNTNEGLPANLSGATGPQAAIHHGLKAVQIGASAWTAEALKLTMPATAFSRSTECHNQDKVSMGTIAARDALRILTLTEQCTAAMLIAVTQGFNLRQKAGEIEMNQLPPQVQAFVQSLQETIPFLEEDRPLEQTLRNLTDQIQRQHWPFPTQEVR